MTDKDIRDALRHVLPYVRPVALTPAESREFWPAVDFLRKFTGDAPGPGPLVARKAP